MKASEIQSSQTLQDNRVLASEIQLSDHEPKRVSGSDIASNRISASMITATEIRAGSITVDLLPALPQPKPAKPRGLLARLFHKG